MVVVGVPALAAESSGGRRLVAGAEVRIAVRVTMKITFCAFDSPNHIGGPNTALRRLLPALSQLGCEPRVLFFADGDPHAGATARALRQRDIRYWQTRRPAFTEDYVRWVLARLAEDPPDVFVPDYVVQAYYAGRWLRAAGIPTVAVLHGVDKYYDGIVSEFVLGDPAYQVSGLVCVSQALERDLRARHPHLPSTTLVRYIPHGVPVPSRTAQPPVERLSLAYVGRLVEINKRVSEMARVLCRVVREVPGTEAALYGAGPSRPALKRLLSSEGRGLPIRLVGNVDNDRIQSELLDHHATILLSDSEGLPIGLMEAMACGLVPICLRRPSGVLELVQHNVTGLLVDDRGDSFVAAVRRLREEPGLWERLSRAARAKIEVEYSVERSAAQWAAFFQKLRSAAGPRRPIELPSRFDLPPVNPNLAHVDERMRPLPAQALRRLRRRAGAVRRWWRGG
jgi:glycosyltransferase involved in cell wall biosynthesis